jgi:hypothetical protein
MTPHETVSTAAIFTQPTQVLSGIIYYHYVSHPSLAPKFLQLQPSQRREHNTRKSDSKPCPNITPIRAPNLYEFIF